MGFESSGSILPDNQEIIPEEEKEKAIEEGGEESSNPDISEQSLGIETPTDSDYAYLIKLQQDQIDDIERSQVRQGLTFREVAEAIQPLKEKINEYKEKGRAEVDHLILVEEKTIQSLETYPSDEGTQKLIQEHQKKKSFLEKVVRPRFD